MPCRALLVDFCGTLAVERSSRAAIYAGSAARHGLDVSTERMAGLMARTHAELPAAVPCGYRYSDAWFRAFIERIFHGELGLPRERLGELAEELFAAFSAAGTFRVFPEVDEVLAELRRRDFALAVVSNWSEHLEALLANLGLATRFDALLSSAIERVEKPDPELFRRALVRLGVTPADALHVGDDVTNDVDGARAAGIRPILVDRSGTMASARDGISIIADLRGVLDLLPHGQVEPEPSDKPMTDLDSLQADIDRLRDACARLRGRVGERFLGHEEVSELLLLCLLAGGHALLEGAPGLGKTTLVRALAASLALDYRRVQFTPDLMPPDILGTRVLDMEEEGKRRFTFEQGPIFTNILLADEINRATPRTQAALLEAMQEGQVTNFGQTRTLDDPFLVIATQNPIEMEGTYPLPEAQLDRFLFKITIEMPDRDELSAVLGATIGVPTDDRERVLGREELCRMRDLVREVPASSEVVHFVSTLILATHPTNELAPERVRALVRYGSSPRGGQAILLAGKARALTLGRVHVTLEDVEALAAPALRHRILLGYEGEATGVHPDELVADALKAAKRGV